MVLDVCIPGIMCFRRANSYLGLIRIHIYFSSYLSQTDTLKKLITFLPFEASREQAGIPTILGIVCCRPGRSGLNRAMLRGIRMCISRQYRKLLVYVQIL
jgi:hypothetical protein